MDGAFSGAGGWFDRNRNRGSADPTGPSGSLPERFFEAPESRPSGPAAVNLYSFPGARRAFLLHPLPTDFLLYAMGRTESAEAKRAISLYFTELKKMKIAMTGKDLRRMGFPPGPLYNEILQSLLRARLEGRIHSAVEEMEYVREKFGRALQESREWDEGLIV
jgi:hypothetical protein